MNRIVGDWSHSSSLLLLKRVYRFFKYREERSRFFREIEIKRIQDERILSEFDSTTENLIVFFVPGADRFTGAETISGGVISLVSICEETKKLKSIHNAETIMCIFPRDFLFLRHENFNNQTHLYRIEQLPNYFKNVRKLLIHVPELMVTSLTSSLLNAEIKWMATLNLHVNVINANIQLMPPPAHIDKLNQLANLVTITAAHTKYCNLYFRELYGKPLHKFSAWISPEQYICVPYRQKENIIVVSPDGNRHRDKILKRLGAINGLKIVVLQNLSYQNFKEVIAKAKWALTFGEGLDGYILEPIFSGSIGIAVYNEDFFTNDFKAMRGIFSSYEELYSSIESEIRALDNPIDYEKVQRKQFELCAKHYDFSQYLDNIKKFYLQQYTFL